jgi:hypothetical protein
MESGKGIASGFRRRLCDAAATPLVALCGATFYAMQPVNPTTVSLTLA